MRLAVNDESYMIRHLRLFRFAACSRKPLLQQPPLGDGHEYSVSYAPAGSCVTAAYTAPICLQSGYLTPLRRLLQDCAYSLIDDYS